MNTQKIKKLLEKYYEGESTIEEERLLQNFFQQDEIPDELTSYKDHFSYYGDLRQIEPSKDFDPLARIGEAGSSAASRITGLSGLESSLNNRLKWSLRIAAGVIILLIGFSAGLLVNRQGNALTTDEVAALQQEIQQMKSALVYGSGQPLTASERITAVKLSERVPRSAEKLDSEITEILIYTMNNDQNINVREAAAEALFRFRKEPRIRKALVNSLGKQSDPLMQMTLINMLVEIKETSAINEMKKLLMDSDTRDVVKNRLELGIAELKT